MKKKIEKKIEKIVDYIISKPESEITRDDYEIIASEVRDIRFREDKKNQDAKLERLLAMGGVACSDPGKITPIHPVDCA